MDRNNIIECGGFFFIHNFDSGNLGHVERVPTELIAPSVNHKTNTPETPDYEFNMWTRPDCAGTEFENGNRTWFYFGIQASEPAVLVRLNLINLNKQGKMYNQGMAPVTRTLPGKPQWERIRDRPVHSTDDNAFTLTFKYRTTENLKATTFFAFTYPFSFAELQIALNSIDLKMLPLPPPSCPDDIYYCRECLVHSLEGRRVDLLTVTSHHGITKEREMRLKNLFPEATERPFKFANKKIIFVSARVHPGETPSSFVFNGFLNLLLTRSDPIAVALRKHYVFKMIPFLNPDGVARGHYRTDTRGVNLNRVYLNPSLVYHPTVYASRALIRYYHYGCEKDDTLEETSLASRSIQNVTESSETTTSNLDVMVKKKKPLPVKSDRKRKTSITAIKQPSSELKVNSGAKGKAIGTSVGNSKGVGVCGSEETTLSEQVLDMKIQEMPSQTSETEMHKTTSDPVEPSLLTDNLLRSCLGSNVHLTASEELNIPGTNPLRPLRDTLKDSIGLLLDSSSGHTGVNTEPRPSSVKTGWCRECRRAAGERERERERGEREREREREGPRSPAAIGRQLSGGIISMRAESSTLRDIEEYRVHQRQVLQEDSTKKTTTVTHEVDSGPTEAGSVFLCTNCFKRYMVAENKEEIKLSDAMSTASVAVSADEDACEAPPNMEDDVVAVTSPPKEDKTIRAALSAKSKPKKAQPPKEPESGLYLYIDLHGHASKKGIFMYGNHFEETETSVECMLLPRIMSLNNHHFHFSSCNFTERNMYLKDRRDGMSREGSGRVAVLKATGLVRSYTLECNYNTGRLVNALPPTAREGPAAPLANPPTVTPPKYTPHIFEEMRMMSRLKNMEYLGDMNPIQVGRSLGASILDLTGQHPNSRLPCSEHRNINSLREWLRTHTRSSRPQLTMSRLRPKTASPTRLPTYARAKAVPDERKENSYGAKPDEHKRAHSVLAPRAAHDIVSMNVTVKHGVPVAVKSTRYLSDEPKPKSLAQKRRNILSIRKPNSGKSTTGGIVKAKASRRSADDAESPMSAKLSKRSFARQPRGARSDVARCRGAASSSSDDLVGGWEDVAGGTALGAQPESAATLVGKRRPFAPPPPAARLKKIRLKTGL